MARLRNQLDALYRRFENETLLAVKPPVELLDLQRWYLTEFERQGDGEDPRPWTGVTRLDQLQGAS